MADQTDQIFGQIALQQGLATEEQIQLCRAEKLRREGQGSQIGLSSVMVELGYLTAMQVQRLQKAATLSGACAADQTRPDPLATHVTPRPSEQPTAALSDGGDPLIGRLLSGKYQVLEKIGQGGMGAVYRAHHTKLDRLCAVKVLPPEVASNPDLLERFRREARATARFDQNNVVRIFDVDSDGGTEYLAMEFLEGNPLDRLIKQKGKLPVKTSLQIVKQAALGLSAAHAYGIVHRDIKPANLMLTKDGIVKVLDFGLARLVEASSLISQTGLIMGTPHFMSPEQAHGEHADLRSDIYSLGGTLFYLLTGQTPYEASTPTAILLKVVSGEIPSASQVDPKIPAQVSRLIQRMMALSPDDRFQNCDTLVLAIEAILQGAGSRGPLPAVARAEQAPLSQRQKLAICGGIPAAILLLLIVIALSSNGGSSTEEDQAQTQRSAALASHTELMTLLSRRSSTAQAKRAACIDYLKKHPDSAQASQVKLLELEWRQAVTYARWTDELARLRPRVNKLTGQGKQADARKLLADFLRREPRGPAANEARSLMSSIQAAARAVVRPKPPEKITGPTRPTPRGEPLLAELKAALADLRLDRTDKIEPVMRRFSRAVSRTSPEERKLANQITGRTGLMLFTQASYGRCAQVLRPLVVRASVADAPALLIAAVATLRTGEIALGSRLLSRAYSLGLPLSRSALDRLNAIPHYGDTLKLNNGELFHGKLQQKTDETVFFRYSAGKAQRIKIVATDQVESLEQHAPTAKQTSRIIASGTIFERLGLADWLALTARKTQAIKLRREIHEQLQRAIRQAGMLCRACAEIKAKKCQKCRGTGKHRPLCGDCRGTGKQDCGNCQKSGKKQCPNCNGRGTVQVRLRRRPPRPRPCRICRQSGTVTCKQCRGSKRLKCKKCRGKKTGPLTDCPDCDGAQPKHCANCGKTRLSAPPWVALALGAAHHVAQDKPAAEIYWRQLTRDKQLPKDWREWFARRLKELSQHEYAKQLTR